MAPIYPSRIEHKLCKITESNTVAALHLDIRYLDYYQHSSGLYNDTQFHDYPGRMHPEFPSYCSRMISTDNLQPYVPTTIVSTIQYCNTLQKSPENKSLGSIFDSLTMVIPQQQIWKETEYSHTVYAMFNYNNSPAV